VHVSYFHNYSLARYVVHSMPISMETEWRFQSFQKLLSKSLNKTMISRKFYFTCSQISFTEILNHLDLSFVRLAEYTFQDLQYTAITV
jgi:hypothetical protein